MASGVVYLVPPQTGSTPIVDFYDLTRIAGYLNLIGITLCLYMLLCFVVLPPEKTRRHYLSVCFLISIILLALGFIVPFAVRPDTCYDSITPRDMHSSMTCAWAGALLVAGGVATVSWSELNTYILSYLIDIGLVLVRALSMHLQICWDIVPGTKFFWAAQLWGWGFPVVMTTVTLSVTGVAFRFGDYCHVNHHDALGSLWGPLLAVTGVAMVVQLGTFGYCLRVYFRNVFADPRHDTSTSRSASSTMVSTGAKRARAVYNRVIKVIQLQWRGLLLVFLTLVDIIYFSIVFVYLDAQIYHTLDDITNVIPWVECIVGAQGDKNQCLSLGRKIAVNEATLIATLVLLSIVGIQAFLLIGQWSMFTAWFELFKQKKEQRDFISLEANRFSTDKRTYELLNVDTPTTIRSPSETGIKCTVESYINDLPFTETLERSESVSSRDYRRPRMSFSSPRTPNGSRSLTNHLAKSQHPALPKSFNGNF